MNVGARTSRLRTPSHGTRAGSSTAPTRSPRSRVTRTGTRELRPRWQSRSRMPVARRPDCASRMGSTRRQGTTVADWSGLNNTAGAVGTTWTSGRFGGAAAFDGVSDRIDVPVLGTFYNSAFTLEAWVREVDGQARTSGVIGFVGPRSSGGVMIWVDHANGHYHLALAGNPANFLDSGRTPTVAASGSTSRRPTTAPPPASTSAGSKSRAGRSRVRSGARTRGVFGAYNADAFRLLRRSDRQRPCSTTGLTQRQPADRTRHGVANPSARRSPPTGDRRRRRRTAQREVNAGTTTDRTGFNEPMKASTITT